MGQLDGDVLASEPVDQFGQSTPGRVEPALIERRTDRPLAAPGEHQPVAVGRVGQFVDLIDGTPFAAAAPVGDADGAAQVGVTLRVASQHEQMPARRIGGAHPRRDHALGLRLRNRHIQRKLGTEDRRHAVRFGGLGEPHDAVHAVVIGERHRVETEVDRLLDHLLRRARAVEETERRVGV